MKRMVHHRRRQRVETSEVRQDSAITLKTQQEYYTEEAPPGCQPDRRRLFITSTTYVSMMLSCGKNQCATSCSPMVGASWKRFRYFCSSWVTWGMSRRSIGRRPGVLVLLMGAKGRKRESLRETATSATSSKRQRRARWGVFFLRLVVCTASWFSAGSCFCWGERTSPPPASWGSENDANTWHRWKSRMKKRQNIESWLCVQRERSRSATCTWKRAWAAPPLRCKQPEIFPPGSPAAWSPWWARGPRAWNAASCERTGSLSPPSSSACARKGRRLAWKWKEGLSRLGEHAGTRPHVS